MVSWVVSVHHKQDTCSCYKGLATAPRAGQQSTRGSSSCGWSLSRRPGNQYIYQVHHCDTSKVFPVNPAVGSISRLPLQRSQNPPRPLTFQAT